VRTATLLATLGCLLAASIAPADDAPPEVPGEWLFALDEQDVGREQEWFAEGFDDSAWARIAIGQGWEQAGYEYDGVAWYRVRMALPEAPEGKRLLLCFGAVDEEAWVWVNGEFAGEHAEGEGGWTEPFTIDITDLARPGQENLIAVRVHDSLLQGGIYRPVTLAIADPEQPPLRAPDWPEWVARDGFNANYLAWGPDEEKAVQQFEAGLNVVCIKLHLTEPAYPADPDNVQTRVPLTGPHSLGQAAEWGRICRRHGGHLTVVLNMMGEQERDFIGSRTHRGAVSMDGREHVIPCPQDEAWWSLFVQQIVALATVVPDCEGVLLDTESYYGTSLIYPFYGKWPLNLCYCDVCFGEFARDHDLDPTMERAERYAALRERDMIEAYQEHLRGVMRRVGKRVIDTVHAVQPRMFVGLLNFGDNWWFEGLALGLGSADCPTALMTENEYGSPIGPDSLRRIERLRELGAHVVYCPGFLIAGWPAEQMALEAFERQRVADGYWVFCGNNLYDDNWRNREGVWALYEGHEPDDYYSELARAHQAWRAGEGEGGDNLSSLDALELIDDARSSPCEATADGLVLRRMVEAPNLLHDPSFETDWPGKDSPWEMYCTPARDAEVALDGSSVRIDQNIKRANLHQSFATEPGADYLFTVWARLRDVQAERGAVIAVDDRLKFFAGNEDWHPISISFTADEAEPTTRVTVGLQSQFGTVWYDRASVRRVEELELWTRPIALGEGEAWAAVGVEAEADVPHGATLTLEVHDAAGGNEPLLRPAPVPGALRQGLTALSALRPDVRAIRLRLLARLGGPEDEQVTVRRLTVSRAAR